MLETYRWQLPPNWSWGEEVPEYLLELPSVLEALTAIPPGVLEGGDGGRSGDGAAVGPDVAGWSTSKSHDTPHMSTSVFAAVGVGLGVGSVSSDRAPACATVGEQSAYARAVSSDIAWEAHAGGLFATGSRKPRRGSALAANRRRSSALSGGEGHLFASGSHASEIYAETLAGRIARGMRCRRLSIVMPSPKMFGASNEDREPLAFRGSMDNNLMTDGSHHSAIFDATRGLLAICRVSASAATHLNHSGKERENLMAGLASLHATAVGRDGRGTTPSALGAEDIHSGNTIGAGGVVALDAKDTYPEEHATGRLQMSGLTKRASNAQRVSSSPMASVRHQAANMAAYAENGLTARGFPVKAGSLPVPTTGAQSLTHVPAQAPPSPGRHLSVSRPSSTRSAAAAACVSIGAAPKAQSPFDPAFLRLVTVASTRLQGAAGPATPRRATSVNQSSQADKSSLG